MMGCCLCGYDTKCCHQYHKHSEIIKNDTSAQTNDNFSDVLHYNCVNAQKIQFDGSINAVLCKIDNNIIISTNEAIKCILKNKILYVLSHNNCSIQYVYKHNTSFLRDNAHLSNSYNGNSEDIDAKEYSKKWILTHLNLESIIINSAGCIKFTDDASPNEFAVTLNSSAKITIYDKIFTKISANVNGSGVINFINSTSDYFNGSMNGSGRISNLFVKKSATCNINGSGSIYLNADTKCLLNNNIAGSGRIYFNK